MKLKESIPVSNMLKPLTAVDLRSVDFRRIGTSLHGI